MLSGNLFLKFHMSLSHYLFRVGKKSMLLDESVALYRP